MNALKSILFVAVLLMMGATAGLLAHAKTNQRLGLPGVKTRPLEGSGNLEVLLPAELPGYHSVALPQSAQVTNTLPQDTSYGQRVYTADDGFQMLVQVVLMGSSRESIHKPQICLTAQGWNINYEVSSQKTIQVDKPIPYNLPVMRLIASRQLQQRDGQIIPQRGLYVYWYVDADRYTGSLVKRMLWSVHDLVFKTVLDRWAYVSFFAVCPPGQEEPTFDRMKKLIVASAPEFQLVPPGIK